MTEWPLLCFFQIAFLWFVFPFPFDANARSAGLVFARLLNNWNRWRRHCVSHFASLAATHFRGLVSWTNVFGFFGRLQLSGLLVDVIVIAQHQTPCPNHSTQAWVAASTLVQPPYWIHFVSECHWKKNQSGASVEYEPEICSEEHASMQEKCYGLCKKLAFIFSQGKRTNAIARLPEKPTHTSADCFCWKAWCTVQKESKWFAHKQESQLVSFQEATSSQLSRACWGLSGTTVCSCWCGFCHPTMAIVIVVGGRFSSPKCGYSNSKSGAASTALLPKETEWTLSILCIKEAKYLQNTELVNKILPSCWRRLAENRSSTDGFHKSRVVSKWVRVTWRPLDEVETFCCSKR